MRAELDCMGERHEVRLVRGSLVFSAHSAKELELLVRMGERSGCAGFLWAWRTRDVEALHMIWNLCPTKDVFDRVHVDWIVSMKRKEARQPDRKLKRERLLASSGRIDRSGLVSP